MSRISLNMESFISEWKTEKTVESGAAGVISETDAVSSQSSQDQVSLSEELSDKDWTEYINTVLNRLKEQYSSINIVIDEEEGSDLSKIAADLGSGSNLVVTRRFLERMGSSMEEFVRCSSVLTGIAKQLNSSSGNSVSTGAYIGISSAAFWSASPKQEADEAGSLSPITWNTSDSEKTDQIIRQVSGNSAITVSRQYSRMASARTKGQVMTVMSDVSRAISSLQMTAVSGEAEERVKANRALRSLKKLLIRGNKKVSRLNKEMLAQMKQKKAEKEQKEKKAGQASEEKNQARVSGIRSNYSLSMEGRADESYIKGYRQYRSKSVPSDFSYLSGSATVGSSTAVADTTTPSGEIAASDVVVTGTVNF